MFDTYDRDDDDHPLDLTTYPLLDQNGIENRIYGPQGNRICRHSVIYDEDTPPCGVLVDLTNVHDMYRDADDNGEGLRRIRLAERRRRASASSSSDDDEDAPHPTYDDEDLEHEIQAMLDSRTTEDRHLRVDAYPQAFLAKYGHVQSNRMFPLYNSFIVNMEREIRKHVPPIPDELREPEDQEEHVYVDPVERDEWFNTYGGTGFIVEPCA